MLEFLSRGFLGYRADFLSDLLILALFGIVPALLAAIIAGRKRNLFLHKILMWIVVSVVVIYVVIYESSMMARGGVDFLRRSIRMPETIYFTALTVHILLALSALSLSVYAIIRGREAFRIEGTETGGKLQKIHCKTGYRAFTLLLIGVATGIAVYYLTFVYTAPLYP